jgi:chromosome segregation ATPase
MKTTSILIFALLSLIFTSSILYTQQPQDNDFQHYLAKINAILDKTPENLSQPEINLLNEALSRSNKYYGENYQTSFKNLKQQVKKKIDDYNEYLEKAGQTKQKFEQKDQQIQETEGALYKTQAERDSIAKVNVQLGEQIQDLKSLIGKLKNERKSLEKVNKKLISEAATVQMNLEKSTATVKRIQDLLALTQVKSEVTAGLPQTLKDSLQNVECQVSDMIKANYTLTLRSMENNEKYIDSLRKYIKDNKQVPNDLSDYLEKGKKIAENMKVNQLDCVKANGEIISDSIDDFQNLLMKGPKSVIVKYLVPSLIVLIVLLVGIMIFRRKKVKKPL